MNTEAIYPQSGADTHARGTVRPLISEIRMSRLRHPRASILAMVLLAAVFLAFGLDSSLRAAPELHRSIAGQAQITAAGRPARPQAVGREHQQQKSRPCELEAERRVGEQEGQQCESGGQVMGRPEPGAFAGP